jgi:hypothetical protein
MISLQTDPIKIPGPNFIDWRKFFPILGKKIRQNKIVIDLENFLEA